MLFIILICFFPFFFLTITYNFYDFNKQYLLFFVGIIILINYAKKIVRDNKICFSLSSLDKYILFFLTSIWLSFLLSVHHNAYSIASVSLFGPLTLTAFVLLYFSVKHSSFGFDRIVTPFFCSGIVFSTLILAQQFDLNPWNKNPYWSPLGYFPNVIVFSAILISASAVNLFCLIKNNLHASVIVNVGKQTLEISKKQIFIAVASILCLILSSSLLMSSLNLLSSTNSIKPFMLNQENGWQITISAMKDFKTAIFGVGSGNFSIAASKFRPESLYPLLSSSKTIVLGSNLYLQFLTEYGLLTFMAFMIILIFIMRNLFTRINIDNAVLFFGLFISILLQLFCPPSIVGLFFFFLFLAFFDKKSKNIFFYNLSGHKIIKSVAVFLLILDLFLFILFSKNYLSEVFYHRAIVSYNADSKNSYNNINIALFLNSKNPYYHLYLAGLYKNDAILLSKLSDLSPENNEKMRNLITLSINEFKYASLLAPSNPVLYFELGKTYLDFMNVVRKSVDEAIKNLNSALEIDRTNPNYHFYLGKAYIANGKYFLAQKELELATLIDPTFVNAYYNLYYSFLKQGLMNQALAALTKTKELLSPTHHQYDKISAELLEFEKFGKENLPFENPKQNFGSLESVGQ